MNGLPWAGISLDAYTCCGTPHLALGWGRSRGIHNTTSVLPKRWPGHGFAQLLVAVRGTSVPLGLCYAADPTAPGRRGKRLWPPSAGSSERGGEIVSRRLQVFIPTRQCIVQIKALEYLPVLPFLM